MLTAVQQHAIDRFAKSLATLGDDSLIDAYHLAWEDHRDARARGQRQPRQSRRRESCDRNGDAPALSGLSRPLQGPVPMNQLVPVASATPPALVAAPASVPGCGSSNSSPPTTACPRR